MSEFFPDKFTPLERTIVGEAAALLVLLGRRSVSVGQLYVEHRQTATASTYDGFVAAEDVKQSETRVVTRSV